MYENEDGYYFAEAGTKFYFPVSGEFADAQRAANAMNTFTPGTTSLEPFKKVLPPGKPDHYEEYDEIIEPPDEPSEEFESVIGTLDVTVVNYLGAYSFHAQVTGGILCTGTLISKKVGITNMHCSVA